MRNVIFINSNEELPSISESYVGWYVLKDSKLYIGTSEGWKELTNSYIGDLATLTTENKTTIVSAINEIQSSLTDINTILESVLNDK